MKQLRIISLLCAAILFSAVACAQKITFSSLNNVDGVSKVFIGKAMLSMAGNSVNLGNVPMGVVKNLDSMEIYSSESKSGSNAIKKAFDEYVTSVDNLNLLMQVSEDDEDVSIYGTEKSGSKNMSRMLIYVKDSDEATLIVMNGDIDPSQISGMVN